MAKRTAKAKRVRTGRAAARTTDKARQLAAELAASPGDVELRRVFADALLEQGGEHAVRGELVQLALADHPAPDELLASFEASLANRGITGLQHAGGFVRSWTCTSDDFASFASEVFADEPLLREVVIDLRHKDVHLQLATLASTPELARVRRLAIVGHQHRTGRLGAGGLELLMRSPHWPKLEALRLPNCSIGDAGAKLIAGAASLSELRELDLASNELKSIAVVALAGSPHLARLTWLSLRENKPGKRGIKALVESPHLTALEYLDTSKTWLSASDVAALPARFAGLVHRHNN